MGGTFMSMPEDYRHRFVAGLHNALSGHTSDDVDEAVLSVEVSQFMGCTITGTLRFTLQVLGAEQDEMRRYHYRDATGLLSETPPEVSPIVCPP